MNTTQSWCIDTATAWGESLRIHSSGHPTACQSSQQAQGLQPILRLLSSAPRRWCPLSLYVRRRSHHSTMLERHEKREARLREQCDVVSSMIIAMRPVYEAASPQQRALLETIVGAAIWYIPKPVLAWTGQISRGALQAFHPESGNSRPRLSEEHVYPRKVAARLLLSDASLTGESMAC